MNRISMEKISFQSCSFNFEDFGQKNVWVLKYFIISSSAIISSILKEGTKLTPNICT